MKAIYTIQYFAKRFAMLMAVGMMAVNAWGADYNLVTDASTLSNGDVILIVTEGRSVTTKISKVTYTATYGDQAMNTTANSNHLLSDNVSISSTTITSTTATEFTLTGNSSAWKIHNGNNYLYTAERNKISTTTEANGLTFTIEIDPSTHAATIQTTKDDFELNKTTTGPLMVKFHATSTNENLPNIYYALYAASMTTEVYEVFIYKKASSCANTMTISKGTGTNCSFTLGTSGSGIESCSGVSTTVTVTPNTGYGSPSVTQSGASAAPTISGSGNNWTVSYGNNTTGTSTINVSCSANQYTVTLNDNGGSSGSGSKTVTYNANTNLTSSVTVPTKAHHDFAGYWTSTDGGSTFGTKLVNADGSWVASVTNYTDASKNWIKADNVTLYAKWTEHSLTNYRTSCCTELGTIDGEASLTQAGNSVTISGWSDVSNVGTYTVKLYKKNGASWDLVSGTTSGGSAGAQGTRTGITSGSKSVTYTGLEVESEYKFTVQAIAGSAAYCDGVETAVTEINSTDVSSTPFKFRYSIYIDNGSNSGWAHHYIEPTGNTDEGSVDITLAGPVDYYQFKIGGGFSGWWGQTGESKYTTGGTQWTLDGSQNVKMQTWIGGTYTFTVDYSGTTNPKVTITYPSANQDAGNIVYWDASVVANWDHLHFRVGTDGNANAGSDCKTDLQKVPGTDNFYKVTTASFTGMRVWAIANNTGWTGSNTNGVYKTNTGDDYAVTLSSDYQDYVVEEDGVTLVPYGSGAMGSYSHDNNCRFYTVTKTDGMLTHNVSLNSPAHGTLLVTYTNTSGTTGQTVTEGNNADLAHRCILTITATPDDGYTCTSLTVNSSNFTSGNTHILSADAVVEATFTAKSCTVNFDKNSGTGGDASTTATYGSAMTTVTAPTRTGYTFDGYWDAETDNDGSGTQYYLANGTSARNWDKDVTAAQTLYAKWNAKQYTIELDREGASTGAESVTATYDAGTLAGWSAPTKTGYTFGGYYSGDNGEGTLVISSTGVLQNSVTISAVNWTDASGHWIKDGGVTLYAKWTADEYTISYKDQGNVDYSGSNLASLPTSHTYGAATDLVDGVRSGYRFDGWFDNSTCSGSKITSIGATAITANTTYYAKWTAIYTVTWHVNGEEWTDGVVTGNSQVVSGEKISTMPDAPDNDLLINCANNFMGWSTQNAGTTPKTTSYYNDLFTTVSGSPEITSNTDFYAVYAELTPSITSWAAGSYYMIETYNNHYYALTGDVSSGAVTATDVTDAVTYNSDLGTITLNPSHSSVLPTMIYTLALSEGVYSITTSTSGCIKSGSNASLTGCGGTNVWNQLDKDDADATRRFGFVCSGQTRTILYNSSNGFKNFATSNRGSSSYGTGYFYLVPTTASNYVTQCASTQVRVNYVGNGGSAPSCSSGVTTKSDSYTICSTEPTKSYYDFKGWNDGTNTYDAGDSYDLQDNTTFTAQWSATKYDITYELDGGTNHGDNPVKYTIEDEDIVLGEPTKDHYRFDGWYQTYSAGVFSNPITTISSGSHGNITVYAKWVAAYVITWDNPMGASVASTLVDQGSALGDLPVPSGSCTVGGVTYSNFVGWYTGTISGLGSAASDAGTQVTSATIPTGDVTYHAVYTNKPDYSSTQTSNVQLPAGNPTNCSLTHIKVSSTDGAPTYRAVKMGTSSSKSDNSFTVTVPIGTTSLILHGVGWKDKTANVLISGADGVTITPATKQQLTAHENATGTIDGTSTKVFATHDTETFTISGIDATAKQTITITHVDERIIVWGINAAVPSGSTAKYITSCCSNIVTLNGGSPSNGTVSFSPSGTIGTCDDDVEVTMTITPASGYQLASFSVATGDDKVAPTSTSPAVVTNKNSSAAQEIDLTFAEDANGAYDVTASFTEMTVTSWTWTNHEGGGAIPNPLNLYVGQSARVDVAYNPSSVLSSHKNYSRSKDDTYINWPGGAQPSAYCTFIGKASTGENTTTITLTHSDAALEQLVYVKVLPLPLTHFVDLVHGKPFADVAATIEANALSATKTTPTSDDWTTPNANTCEENHLHLVGWIREDWPALEAYLNGTGDAPTTTAIVGAGNDGSGNAYFIAAGASINVQTFDGVTFYAVWAEIK